MTSTQVFAQTSAAQVENRNANSQHLINERVPEWLETLDIPSVAVAFVEHGRVAWVSTHGEQSPGVPATTDTLYNVASMAKPVSAETVLRLASAEKLSIDQSMAEHWVDPDIKGSPWIDLLTPRLCLSHQSGFPNWRYQTDDVLTFLWQPGTRSGYSGEGFEYVAQFAENKTGTSFTTLAKNLVFDPVGMTETSYVRQDWFHGRVAHPKGPEGKFGEPTIRDSWVASDDLYTTASDYAKFMASVMRNEMLSAEIIEARQTIHVDKIESLCQSDKRKVATCPEQAGIGLGWNIWRYKEETVFWHTGGDWGEETIGFFVPERQSGLVIFTNGTHGMKIMFRIAETILPGLAFNEFLEYQAR